MTLNGDVVRFASPAAANAAGIVCIFQELSLVPDLSVADNICISNPPRRFGLIDRRAQRRIAEEALARAGGEDITRWRRSRTCRCRAANWSRSPRPWCATRAS